MNEASALLGLETALPGTAEPAQAWWVAHDEAEGTELVSVLIEEPGGVWSVRDVALHGSARSTASPEDMTDAEALARTGDYVVVFGSGFLDGRGRLDGRRSFVSRFREDAVVFERDGKHKALSVEADQLDLGSSLRVAFRDARALQGLELLAVTDAVAREMTKADEDGLVPLNVEGAACLGDDLLLGLRWPVHASGNPFIVNLRGGASWLRSPDLTTDGLTDLSMTVDVAPTSGSQRRPNGVRGMTSDAEGDLHLIVGSTERDLVDHKTKRSGFVHVQWDRRSNEAAQIVETFEGYRRVEGIARRNDGWIYALDDEDAVVVLTKD